MRTALLALLVVAGLAAQGEELKDVPGAILEVNAKNGWYAIVPDSVSDGVPDGDRGTRYAPDRLSDEFKKDGLRVIFSGRVGRVDANVRAWGVPLALTAIRLAPLRR